MSPSICEIKKTTPDLIEINSQLLWDNVCGAIGSINQFVLVEKTDLLRDHASLNTSTGSRDYTPYPSPYERGNFFHRGSPEEELIDSNDGLMKSWEREINGIFEKLMSCEQELETLHKVYFEDISISEWKKEHDKYDSIAEHSREWHRLGVVSTSIVGIGAGAYSYSSNKKITSKNINDLPYNVQDSYTKYSNYSTKKVNLHGIIMLLHMVLHKSR